MVVVFIQILWKVVWVAIITEQHGLHQANEGEAFPSNNLK